MKNTSTFLCLFLCFVLAIPSYSQRKKNKKNKALTTTSIKPDFDAKQFDALKWRNIGPFRGGRSNAVTGVRGNPLRYYFGSTGGGVWQTDDAGQNWKNISDGFFNTGSVGAIAIAPSDPNVMYVGMGEHAVRGVMTSHGDGVYKSTDAGKTWVHLGLKQSRHIASIEIHPQNPDVVWVAVQGAVHGPTQERGVYKSTDGGKNWKRVLFVNENTGASDLSMDESNPRILFAGMWEHRRYPWTVQSGGEGSGLYKSTDGGETWEKLSEGLPEKMGKVAVDISPATPDRIFANIEAETGGVFRSDNGGKTWKQTCKDRVTIARAWYYIEIFADPQDAETVYVLNAPMLKSIDGGKSFRPISNPHSDQHDLWINPNNPQNMILGNDGGGCITFNGGQSWSSQRNQPTAQFYRIIADKRFPYYLYAGQQDNSAIAIASRTIRGGIGWKDWYSVAGGESAFLAFDADNPEIVYGGSYQGNISTYNQENGHRKDIMAYPVVGLAELPKEMRYRFNWNAPIVAQPQNPNIIYHGGNRVLKTNDEGQSWAVISPDLTRNDTTKHGPGGMPFTNEGAGGENYNTISYMACSPHQAGVLWVGSDDGLVHLTQDDGQNWSNVTPNGIGEAIINAIEVSPHDAASAYIAVTRYKFNDFQPMIFITNDYGKTWRKAVQGIGKEDFVRVVREDHKQKGLLYAGTETGLYVSFNDGGKWHRFQSNLPICPINDMCIRDNNLNVATSGRSFWILDDLSALQQSGGILVDNKIRLFQPKPTYRYNLSSSSQARPNLGQNPNGGIVFDYYLPEDMDTTSLILEILDEKGEVLRTYSNQKDKSFKSGPGGPPPSPLLPAKAGVNRFNWDLRKATLEAIPGVFIYGNYRGHLMPPGTYQLRLMSEKDTVSTTCELLADPRIKATAKDYAAQQNILNSVEQAVKDIHASINRMRKVKKQVESKLSLLNGNEEWKELANTGKAVAKKISAWEENLIQPKQKTFQDVINFPNQLSSDLLDLKRRVDGLLPEPTKGAKERLDDLLAVWKTHQQELERIISEDVAAFNELYKEKQLPALIVPEKK